MPGNETEKIDKVVAALRTVPPKKLLIIELVNSVQIVNGELDYQELTNRQLEVKLAIDEAKVYGAHTLQAVDALVRLKTKNGAEDVGYRPDHTAE
jgi:hypothetical protein